MKKGFALIAVAVVFGSFIIVGSGLITAQYFFNKNSSKSQDDSAGKPSGGTLSQKPQSTSSNSQQTGSLAVPQGGESTPGALKATDSVSTPTVYTQP